MLPRPTADSSNQIAGQNNSTIVFLSAVAETNPKS